MLWVILTHQMECLTDFKKTLEGEWMNILCHIFITKGFYLKPLDLESTGNIYKTFKCTCTLMICWCSLSYVLLH